MTAHVLPYGNPENVTAPDGSDSAVDISWDDMDEVDPDHYQTPYTYDAGFSYWLDAGSIPALTCSGTKLLPPAGLLLPHDILPCARLP